MQGGRQIFAAAAEKILIAHENFSRVIFRRKCVMKFFTSILSIAIFLCAAEAAAASMTLNVHNIKLGESSIAVNVYETPTAGVTFVALHRNERTSINAAREFVAKYGGRLVELAPDASGKTPRNIEFLMNGKFYSVDPNRIFTANGRRCAADAELEGELAAFAGQIISLALNSERKLIVALHNNSDADAKGKPVRTGDLTATAFAAAVAKTKFADQAAGVFLSNSERDPDNFVFLANSAYLTYFSDKGFNVVLQKNASSLTSEACSVDDGSLSVYAAQNGIDYICLEADAVSGGIRQREMLTAVYELFGVKN